MENVNKKKGLKGFIKGSAIGLVIFLILLVVALSVFWKYLDCYQKADSLIPVNEFVDLIKRSNFKTALSVSDKTGVFSDEEQFSLFISENFEDGFGAVNVVCVSDNDDKSIYEIYNNFDRVFTLNVSNLGEEIGFGINKSIITELSVDCIDPIGITVPSGSVVYVNGTILDNTTAEEVNVTDIFADIPVEVMPKMQKYITEGHLIYPEISVVYKNQIINDDETVSEQDIICELVNDNEFDLIYAGGFTEIDYPDVALKALDTAKNFESYMCRGIHKNYLLRHIYTESALYEEIKEFDNSSLERQYGVSFSEGKYDGIYMLDESHYIVLLNISKTYKTTNETKVDTEEYMVNIINVDGKFYATDIFTK